MEEERDRLLTVKRGGMPWEDVNLWRQELHHDFEEALKTSCLPERPDYEAVNTFLVEARRAAAQSR